MVYKEYVFQRFDYYLIIRCLNNNILNKYITFWPTQKKWTYPTNIQSIIT